MMLAFRQVMEGQGFELVTGATSLKVSFPSLFYVREVSEIWVLLFDPPGMYSGYENVSYFLNALGRNFESWLPISVEDADFFNWFDGDLQFSSQP